jgi:hypothetical protein
MAGGLSVGSFAGLPNWLVQLIVQMPLVALFYYREARERGDRKTAQAKLEKYLLDAPDKLMNFTEAHREAWNTLEKKIDAVLGKKKDSGD